MITALRAPTKPEHDVLNRGGRKAVPVESRADRVKLYRVVRLLHIIAHNVEGSATVALKRAKILEDIERRVHTL